MLSVEQRYNICLMAERHPKWTQLELAKWAYDTFQLSKIPSQGTISRLLAKRVTYMNCKEHEKDANRIRKPNNLLVRKILQEWISQSIWNGIPITSPIIQDTAQAVWHRIPAEHREGNGSFTYKWISNFLSKMDVNISVLDEEMPKTPKVWTFEERNQLKIMFSTVDPKNLFTLDETFLAYNLPLDYAQYETSSIQRRIEVATVMLCANLDGSEKLKPLVVGKYNSYRSFRNYFPDEPTDLVSLSQLGEKMAKKFGISYHSNRKSWLTSNLFHNWLARWDKRLVADNRKIIIVLDDSCSHRIINLHLQNITLVYTSANSRFLPFNWGVLDEFKTKYRIQQYQALIGLQRKIESKLNGKQYYISFEQSQLTMSNAFKFIKAAWDSIPLDTIKANWKSSGIIPQELIEINENVSMAFKKNELLENYLNKLCSEYHCVKQWEYDTLLDLNIENKNNNFLSTEELVESSIVDPIEPENTCYPGSAISSTSASQIGIDELMYQINVEGISSNSDDDDDEGDDDDDGNKHNANILNTNNINNVTNDLNSIIGLPTQNHDGNNNFVADSYNTQINNLSNSLDKADPTVSKFAMNNSNNNPTPNLVVNNINGALDSQFHKFFLDSYNQSSENNGNNIFNVSTLIDKPNLFLNEPYNNTNNKDLDLRDIDVNLEGQTYFNDIFHSSSNNQSLTNNPSDNGSIKNVKNNENIYFENDKSSHASNTASHHANTVASNETANSTSKNILVNNENSNNGNEGLIPPSHFDDPKIAQLLNRRSVGDISATFDNLQNTRSSTNNDSYSLNHLQSNIEIAKSLGNIIKHTETNDIQFSKSTTNELKITYSNLLKKIKKTRKQLYKSKQKSNEERLDTLLANTDIPDSIILNTDSEAPALDISMKDNSSFF